MIGTIVLIIGFLLMISATGKLSEMAEITWSELVTYNLGIIIELILGVTILFIGIHLSQILTT
jgi:hypothetical protein